jgi:hypothetical protein
MVKVQYIGRLGNNMFQYALGRYLAEEMGYKLSAEPLPFHKTTEDVPGRSYNEPVKVLNGQLCDIPAVLADKTHGSIILAGWFQQSRYYMPFLDRIRRWYSIDIDKPSQMIDIDDLDLLLSIRLGDYFLPFRWSLTHQFYETAIEMAAPRKIYIATDEPGHPFLDKFKKHSPTLLVWKREQKPVMDMFSARHFKKIALSCSTFSWWSAFLSEATEIYFPIDEDGLWSMCHRAPESLTTNVITSIDLRLDSPRFIYFYNCPTVNTNRFSPAIVPLTVARPEIALFHQRSKAFWYD